MNSDMDEGEGNPFVQSPEQRAQEQREQQLKELREIRLLLEKTKEETEVGIDRLQRSLVYVLVVLGAIGFALSGGKWFCG